MSTTGHWPRIRPVVAIIPARFGSTRLPGKALLNDTGRPLIQYVIEAVGRARRVDRVVVATDDVRIVEAVEAVGAEATMTREDHRSGTDRVLEAASRIPEATLIVNVQGDEPEVEPDHIDQLVEELAGHPEAPMATLSAPLNDPTAYRDPARVKVVCNRNGNALYFSRAPIPFHRADPKALPDDSGARLHLGLYAFRRDFLIDVWPTLPASRLEAIESLEQLRVLEAGHAIRVGHVDRAGFGGIDTSEDYRRFVRRVRDRQQTDAA